MFSFFNRYFSWVSIEIFAMIVSVISIFISNWLGVQRYKDELMFNEKLKRYNELYVPYMGFLIENYYDFTDPYSFSTELDKEFYDLISKNIQHFGKNSAEKLPKFFSIYPLKQLPDEYINKPKNLRSTYHNLIISLNTEVLSEASELSKLIGKPDLADTISISYDFLSKQENDL